VLEVEATSSTVVLGYLDLMERLMKVQCVSVGSCFRTLLAIGILVSSGEWAQAGIRITEFMYQGYSGVGAQRDGEFVEFTNLGTEPIDMTGWYFDDENAFDPQPFHTPEPFDLSGFGVVVPGESVILTAETPTGFRSAWGLSGNVKVVGYLGTSWGNNLGRNDEINLFDMHGNLVDQLRYGDSVYRPGSIRTQWASGNPSSLEVVGTNEASHWQLSYVGDDFGSWMSVNGEVGNPGKYTSIPEPSSFALLAVFSVMLFARAALRGREY